ncbi:hypothetical protein HMPREF7215_2565 [Pyramidobacter piscolens W5455]|uniref:Uncharacterized protein n=2 Tax=Pyramidobacter piscolens TaxID=638849 RepID=A0ABP2HRE2_9BACT|nr:hypothetical protein HMPREF7215_2565 [Pyramidobacter piscolens W5455]
MNMANDLKWLPQFTDEELVVLHRKCFGDNVDSLASRDDEHGDYTFFEDGWGGDEEPDLLLETAYYYNDFDCPRPVDWSGSDVGLHARFVEYMYKRFGAPYIVDFARYMTNGADVREYLEYA